MRRTSSQTTTKKTETRPWFINAHGDEHWDAIRARPCRRRQGTSWLGVCELWGTRRGKWTPNLPRSDATACNLRTPRDGCTKTMHRSTLGSPSTKTTNQTKLKASTTSASIPSVVPDAAICVFQPRRGNWERRRAAEWCKAAGGGIRYRRVSGTVTESFARGGEKWGWMNHRPLTPFKQRRFTATCLV